MNRLRFNRSVPAMLLMVGPFSVASCAAREEAATHVLDGAIQRASAIRSGKLEYQFEAGSIGTNTVPPRRGPKKIAAFLGDSWIDRTSDARHAELRCEGLIVRFDVTEQSDGSVKYLATVEPASQSRGPADRIPAFAGTFWKASQLEFVKSHRREARSAGAENVDGVACEVLSIAIDPEQVGNVVPFVLPSLASGAELRMYVAAELGFAMPLIRILAADGTPVVSYSSREFTRFPQGIWFPGKTRLEIQLPNGTRRFEQFSVTPLALNESGLLEELVIQFPAATTVLDQRDSGGSRRLELQSATTSVDLLGIPGELARSNASSDTNGRVLIAAAILAIAGLVAARLVYARRGRRLAPTDR